MTDSANAAAADSWESALPALQRRFPKATPGILFCVFKLQQDAALTIPEFRQEALQLDISLGGRALHSARVLLGLAEAVERTPARSRVKAKPATRRARGRAVPVENDLIRAIQRLQDDAKQESRRLRDAMRKAAKILEDALGEE